MSSVTKIQIRISPWSVDLGILCHLLLNKFYLLLKRTPWFIAYLSWVKMWGPLAVANVCIFSRTLGYWRVQLFSVVLCRQNAQRRRLNILILLQRLRALASLARQGLDVNDDSSLVDEQMTSLAATTLANGINSSPTSRVNTCSDYVTLRVIVNVDYKRWLNKRRCRRPVTTWYAAVRPVAECLRRRQ